MNSPPLDFWFEFASTYSYLSAARIGGVAKVAGVRLRYRPFLLGPIFASQGWKDSPFNLYAAKGRYMWRDMERLCEQYGLPFARPSQFPRNGLLAARVACAAHDEPWLPDFVAAVYRANFAEDRDIARPEVVGELLEELGQAGSAWTQRALAPATKERLRAATEAARSAGIFGAPSFTVGRELFWGNDRMGDAIACCRLAAHATGAAAAPRR